MRQVTLFLYESQRLKSTSIQRGGLMCQRWTKEFFVFLAFCSEFTRSKQRAIPVTKFLFSNTYSWNSLKISNKVHIPEILSQFLSYWRCIIFFIFEIIIAASFPSLSFLETLPYSLPCFPLNSWPLFSSIFTACIYVYASLIITCSIWLMLLKCLFN